MFLVLQSFSLLKFLEFVYVSGSSKFFTAVTVLYVHYLLQ